VVPVNEAMFWGFFAVLGFGSYRYGRRVMATDISR
jgi:hypothetical protein